MISTIVTKQVYFYAHKEVYKLYRLFDSFGGMCIYKHIIIIHMILFGMWLLIQFVQIE